MCSLGSWTEVNSRARYFGRTNQIRRRCKQTLFSGKKSYIVMWRRRKALASVEIERRTLQRPKSLLFRSLWSLRARAERKPAFKHFLPLQYSKAYHVIRTKRIWCVKKKKKKKSLCIRVESNNNLGAQKFVLPISALVDQIRHWILIKTNSN